MQRISSFETLTSIDLRSSSLTPTSVELLALRGLRKFSDALEYLDKAQRDRIAIDDYVALAVDSARMGTLSGNGSRRGGIGHRRSRNSRLRRHRMLSLNLLRRGFGLACASQEAEAKRVATRSQSVSFAAEPRLLARLAVLP